jgi:hypothetical protein
MLTSDVMDDVMTTSIHFFVKGYALFVDQYPLFVDLYPLFVEQYPLFLEQLNSPYYDAMPRCRCHMEEENYNPYYL